MLITCGIKYIELVITPIPLVFVFGYFGYLLLMAHKKKKMDIVANEIDGTVENITIFFMVLFVMIVSTMIANKWAS